MHFAFAWPSNIPLLPTESTNILASAAWTRRICISKSAVIPEVKAATLTSTRARRRWNAPAPKPAAASEMTLTALEEEDEAALGQYRRWRSSTESLSLAMKCTPKSGKLPIPIGEQWAFSRKRPACFHLFTSSFHPPLWLTGSILSMSLISGTNEIIVWACVQAPWTQ